MSNTMMDFISISSGAFPAMFNGPGNTERLGGGGGQKVVCTPEVSLYTYNGNGPSAVPSPTSPISVDDKGGGGSGMVDLDGSDPLAHHTPNGFQCGVCGKIFQQKNTFQNHLRSHREGEDPYQCDICGKTFAVPARLTRHYRTHTGEKPYQCEYCNKSFSVKENLSVHRRIHTKERPYKCEVCERAFEHSGKLHRHMRIHTGERPHRCQICQKTFIQSGQLVIHMRTHTGEKPYVCKVCSKGFTCSKQLKVHSRTHTGEKPYSCDICGKSFGYNHVLKLHQVAHYGEKVYKCTICNSTFNSKKALESHIKTHSSSEPMSPSMTPPPLVEGLHQARLSSESRNLSPPSNSHGARQHSDKENRGESSDSEVSSQNSPTSLESSPRSPSSPKIYTPSARSTGSAVKSNGSHYSSSPGNNTQSPVTGSTLGSLPYPMLPPGVQIHQPPQSRTTFLYVTSKLPSVAGSGSPANHGISSVGNSFSSGGPDGQGLHPRSIQVKSSPPRQTDVARDKFLRQSASIRDKVLASIEMFGYGLSGDSSSSSSGSNGSSSNGSTDLTIRPKGVQITPVTHLGSSSGGGVGFGRGNYQDSTINRNTMSGALVREGNVSITPIPENLTNYAQLSRQYGRERSREDYAYSPYPYHSSCSPYPLLSKVRDRSRSPESPPRGGYNFGSGGVLALALTRGSKAVVNQLPFSMAMPLRTAKPTIFAPAPTIHQTQTPPHSNPESPDLCIDFSRRAGSVSPTNNGVNSPTPSTTPRSTPGLSESAEDLSEDYHHHHHHHSFTTTKEGLEIIGLGKRSASNGSSYGPRKRSSLILEKYAQENHPSTEQGSATESILSQRLRQSSVIQFAERCT